MTPTTQTIMAPNRSKSQFQDQMKHPLVNVMCREESSKTLSNKQAHADILECCVQLLTCLCIESHCQFDPIYKNGKYCMELPNHPCHTKPNCYHLPMKIIHEKCVALPEMIGIFGYKKYIQLKKQDESQPPPPQHKKAANTSSSNVDSSQYVSSVQQQPSQTDKSQSSKQKNSGGGGAGGGQSSSSGVSSKSSKKQPNNGKKFSKNSIKPAKSSLQK
ncbi:hypothetical protein DERF_011109 [Dermatophagoides farinae]|uniref:Uncharacterized protein n=1 Tax=Dermatophagoides farinae TaxID=6954 RepID=A0A922HWG5_DERFA|nr:hypothetical protein DERF_011109 [Dermatophagoides farinae]